MKNPTATVGPKLGLLGVFEAYKSGMTLRYSRSDRTLRTGLLAVLLGAIASRLERSNGHRASNGAIGREELEVEFATPGNGVRMEHGPSRTSR